uniref:U6 snRNA phosphodiesterase 1 n=1 Tax=Erpetoichthys calabaricus TaxID=27687 RepID=A0A8C4TLA4_ERPCA
MTLMHRAVLFPYRLPEVRNRGGTSNLHSLVRPELRWWCTRTADRSAPGFWRCSSTTAALRTRKAMVAGSGDGAETRRRRLRAVSAVNLGRDFAERDFEELADRLISAAGAHGISLTRMEEFHISLSQTVVLRHHWIEPFVLSLKEALAPFSRFLCVADRLNVYANQEKTRTFLGLEVTLGQDELVHVVGAIDKTLKASRLATFYQNPSFHISLAWCVGDHKERLEGLCAQLQGIVHDSEDGGELTRLWAEDIRCKSGNKVFSFQLHRD